MSADQPHGPHYRLSANHDITGRDGFILRKAVLYAISTIQVLPHERQEWSDLRDMKALARALLPGLRERDFMADNVARHTGVRPDLTPGAEDEGDDGWEHGG